MPKKNKAISTERLYWGKSYSSLPKLDFVSIQSESYQKFLDEGIIELINEINPVSDFTGKNWELTLGKYSFGKSKYTASLAAVKGVTYDMPVKIQAKLLNKQTGEVTSQEVFFGEVPVMTPSGTFVINGIERVVINQLVRSAGVYFLGDIDPITGRVLHFAEVRPLRGSWLEFNISRSNVISVRVDRRRKFPITTFLRAIGIGSDEEIRKIFSDVDSSVDGKIEDSFIESTLKKDVTHGSSEGAMEIYKKMRPGEPVVLETAMDYINNLFFNVRRYNLGKVGRYKINKRLGLQLENKQENHVLTKQDIVSTIKYLIRLQKADANSYTDDIDHLANRRVRRVGELVGNVAFRDGILRLERAIKERMSLLDPKIRVMPNQVINARPIISAINEFFRTSQLSSILDQTNPLSEVDNLRKLTVMGIGGISRDRASFSIRDINSSQYSRICPVRSPEGPNIGLVTFMSLYARVDEYGFLLAPYRKVVKMGNQMKISDEIVYLAADDERDYKITHAGVGVDSHDIITDARVPVRYRGEFVDVDSLEVSLIDLVPRQVVGSAAALIPFLQHDDGIRALMGSNMQAQAVPLVKPSSPVVGTGVETDVADAMGWVVRARHDGKIVYADGNKVVVKLKEKIKDSFENDEKVKINGNLETYYVTKFYRTNPNGACYCQRTQASVGDKVKPGDVLIDGPAADRGELALGQNMTIAYMHFEGYGYEDAIIVSDRLVRDDLLTSIHIEEYECEVVDTKLGPEELTRDIPNVGETDLANLDEGGIVVVGAEVGPNDILVGKIAPKGETELSAEERLLRAIFGEKAREVRDTSLRMPHGEHGIVISINILDKSAGDELSPGTNKLIKVRVAQIRKISVGDKVAGRHGNKGVISRIVSRADMPHLADGTPIDIIISPLSVLGRMNLGQLLEAHLGWAMSKSQKRVSVPVFENIPEDWLITALEDADLPTDGKTTVYDGRTGEPFEQKIVVGISYILKLIHMVEDKTHARSTGPYSLVTQQPLGGKAQMGGQRLGEMEVWALEAHRAAYTLQEMLTIKSDDVVGRAKAFEAIVKGTDIPQSTVPESFKVLVKELQSLGLLVTPTGAVTAPVVAAVSAKLEEKTEEQVKELKNVLEATVNVEETPAHEAAQGGIEIAEVKSDEEITKDTNE